MDVGLPKVLYRFLLMNAFSFIIFNYIGIFVNLYIWEQGHKIFDVSWFNISLFFTWAFAYSSGAKLLTKQSVRVLFGLSALSGGAAFLLLSFLHMDNRLLWITLIGIPVGSMWGFFSVAQNFSISSFGKGRDFANFFSISNSISQVLNMTVPIVSAQVILWFGYASSFILMLAFVTGMLIVSRLVPDISLNKLVKQDDSWFESIKYKNVFTTPSLKWLVPSCLAAGLFLQFQGLFALLFTFSITQDKTVIALLNTLYTLSSLAALFFYKKFQLQESVWLFVAVTLISAGFLLALYPVAPILILSNILTTIGLFYFSSSWNGQHFHIISQVPASQQSHLFVWRECMLCLTRCVMLVMILPVESFQGVMFVLLIGLGISSLLSVPYFQRRAMRELAAIDSPESHTANAGV